MRLRILRTTSNEVHSNGLLMSNTCPSSNVLGMPAKVSYSTFFITLSTRFRLYGIFVFFSRDLFCQFLVGNFIPAVKRRSQFIYYTHMAWRAFNSRYLFTVFTVRFCGAVSIVKIPCC